MGLFDIFKKPIIIEDDFFGRLKFMKMKNAEKNYFEGKGLFEPTGKEIELFINGSEKGPDQKQKEFYSWLQRNFKELAFKATPLIEDEFRNWKEDFKIKDFDKEFSLVALTIPSQETTPIEWNMSFETIHDENHQVTIEFLGNEPKEVLIDG